MISLLLFVAAGIFLTLFLLSLKNQKTSQTTVIQQTKVVKEKENHGHLQIFYGSQTGTAAKMAQGFAEQAIEKGFTPQVIDLKDIQFKHFDRKGSISVYFLSNTGQGDPPDNMVRFIKVLKGKEQLDSQKIINWKKLGFTVFGLGNTQYQFYNKQGIDVDALLEKKGAQRVYRLGLGDANASLEDDYIQWKDQLWAALIDYRKQNPLEQIVEVQVIQTTQVHKEIPKNRVYLSQKQVRLANYRFYTCKDQSEKFTHKEEDLDFKTKGSLKSQFSRVKRIIQTRQNTLDGSTLQVQVQLQGQPSYDTAANIALYPRNDPQIVQEIINYFNLTEEQLNSFVSIEKIHQDKKLKLNFIPYCRLRELLTDYIDVQGRLTKAILKKLSKFPSKNQEYFSTNSSPKTTPQFKRITQEVTNPKDWYYLFRLIKEFQVYISFQDFIELSDSIAPRLFTIASCYKKQKNVIVSASIVQNGLISKFFISNPQNMRAEFRKSSFTDAMKWQKVIFIGAGTGFAPFRGYLQQKQHLLERKKEGQNANIPQVTLFFGCKHQDGDFIYREQITGWVQNKVIDHFHAAFSRDTQKVIIQLSQKVYVQHLLEKEQKQIEQFLNNPKTAIYICGALGMGHDVSQVLAAKAGGHDKIKQLEQQGRIVKELW